MAFFDSQAFVPEGKKCIKGKGERWSNISHIAIDLDLLVVKSIAIFAM